MTLNELADVFHAISFDAKEAAKRGDNDRFRALTDLVVALERAYPDLMASLRDEGVMDA